MIKRERRLLVISAAALFLFNGCLPVPLSKLLKESEERLFAAKEAGAEECASLEYAAAERKFNDAKQLSKTPGLEDDARVAAMASRKLSERAIKASVLKGKNCKAKLESEKPATKPAQSRGDKLLTE